MDKEFKEKLEEYKKLQEEINKGKDTDGCLDDAASEIGFDLLYNTSIENFLDRETAESLIEEAQQLSLDMEGGWPLWDEVSFNIGDDDFSVIAWGASGEGEGKSALMGMVFVKEDKKGGKKNGS